MEIADIDAPEVEALVKRVRRLRASSGPGKKAYDLIRENVSAELLKTDGVKVVPAAMEKLTGQAGGQRLKAIVEHCRETFYFEDRVLSSVVVPVAIRMKSQMNGVVTIGEARHSDLAFLARALQTHTGAKKVAFDQRLYDGRALECATPSQLRTLLLKVEADGVCPDGGPPRCVVRSESEPMWRMLYFVGVLVGDRGASQCLDSEHTQSRMRVWNYVSERALRECDAVLLNRYASVQVIGHNVCYLGQGLRRGQDLIRTYQLHSLLSNIQRNPLGVKFHYTNDQVKQCVRLLVHSHNLSVQHQWKLQVGETLDAFGQALSQAIEQNLMGREVVEIREVDMSEYRHIVSAKGLAWLGRVSP